VRNVEEVERRGKRMLKSGGERHGSIRNVEEVAGKMREHGEMLKKNLPDKLNIVILR
jgi:hypothetical protein